MSDNTEKDIETVLEEIPLNLLKEYMEGNDIKGKKTTKKVAVESILEWAQKKGESTFIKELEKDALKLALEEHTDKKVDTNSKQKMAKSFKTMFGKQKDKVKFFSESSLELLTKFLAALGMEEDSSKEEKADAVLEEILITGLKLGFTTMNKEFINEVCDALKITKTGAKKACVARIIGQAYPHYLEGPTEEKEKEKNDITQIKAGITFEELYQYYAEELQDYAVQNGLKKTGSKKILCKRILKFLSGDEITTKPLKPGQRHKKKRGGAKKRKADEKDGEEGEEEESEKKDDKKEEKKDDKKEDKSEESKKKKTKK